ncbi:alkaline-phosphatase-like protein [Xylariales sp. PMI_506]|nr:alkaline-phosphatase-like protein [Xylariales sp. PMI_506]
MGMTNFFNSRPIFGDRKLIFAIVAISLLSTKTIRIYLRTSVLSVSDLVVWAPFLYAQDILLLLVSRILLGKQYTTKWRLNVLVNVAILTIVTVLTGMAVLSISFFAVTGLEIHWRDIRVMSDAAALKMAWETGFWPLLAVFNSTLLLSWLVQDFVYIAWGVAASSFLGSLLQLFRVLPWRRRCIPHIESGQRGLKDELEFSIEPAEVGDPVISLASPAAIVCLSLFDTMRWLKIVVGVLLATQLPFALLHPHHSSLCSLVWSLPFTPLVEAAELSSKDYSHFLSVKGMPDWVHQNSTALGPTLVYPWLPSTSAVPGFQDWYEEGANHYISSADPLKISNLHDELLPSLRDKLADIDIRHVMLIILESTRKDIFPLKKEDMIWRRLAASFPDGALPPEAQYRLSTLTPTANFLTGDFEDGFQHMEIPAGRGGIYASNAFTAGTYTLKSLVGTLCGTSPLVGPFNLEYSHHIYQPCLPHVFEAFNRLNQSEDSVEEGFTPFQWKSSFLQSVTGYYDYQDRLMNAIGYNDSDFVTWEYLKEGTAKFGIADDPDINYFGMAEVVLEDYIRDAFSTATENNERVFLTHLTSTTHHPFAIPVSGGGAAEDQKTESYEKRGLNDLSNYLNAVSYVDTWLSRILDILDDQNVANETLVVVLGDHGLSIVEDDAITAYDNANIGNFRVPLVFSHPALPSIEVTDAVTSLQVLPTIMDLLLETNSLSAAESHAARDLIQNYEGQSLLRRLRNVSAETGEAGWQFAVANPGDSLLSVRDPRRPGWRLVVPLLEGFEWRFTDLDSDPYEQSPILAADSTRLAAKLAEEVGSEPVVWLMEAVSVTNWWITENHKRWRYDP